MVGTARLRRPRRVQRRNFRLNRGHGRYKIRTLNACGDAAAQRPYLAWNNFQNLRRDLAQLSTKKLEKIPQIPHPFLGAYADKLMKAVTKITINGRQYHSLEEVPPELREKYAKALQMLRDFETKGPGGLSSESISVKESESIIYNGQKYNSREELPPEAREALAQISESEWKDKTPDVTIEETKVLPSEVKVIEESDWGTRDDQSPSSSRWLVILLLILVFLLLFLWLRGVRPPQLSPH